MGATVNSMNGTIWVFAILLISWVIVQSLLFLRLAARFNSKHKLLTNKEFKQAASSGAVSAIGPSVSSIVVAISLITMLGSGVAFMRCGVIGAPAWEIFMANIVTGTLGIEFDSPEFTKNVLVVCIFGMTIASAPYFLNTILTLKPLDSAINKSAKKAKKESFIPHLSNAAMMAILVYSIYDYVMGGPEKLTAVLSAAVVTFLVSILVRKTGNKTLGSYNMAISMVVGMTVAQIVKSILG